MAVPPAVANAVAQAALDVAIDVTEPLSVRAARSSKRLRIARNLHEANAVTEDELGQHEAFHTACALSAAGGAGNAAIPDDPALAAALAAALPVALAPLHGQMAVLQGQMAAFQGQLSNIEARQVNSIASSPYDVLGALTNGAGIVYPNFPNKLLDLLAMTGVEMSKFLSHYALPAGGEDVEKFQRIKKFIGQRIA